QCEQPCAVYDIHVLRHRDLPNDCIVAPWTSDEPKTPNCCLLRRAFDAVDPSKLTNFVNVLCPSLGGQRRRSSRTKLRAARHHPGSDGSCCGEYWNNGWDIHARSGMGPIRFLGVHSIVCSKRD